MVIIRKELGAVTGGRGSFNFGWLNTQYNKLAVYYRTVHLKQITY